MTQDFIFRFLSLTEREKQLILESYVEITCPVRTGRETSQDIFALPFAEGLYWIHSSALTYILQAFLSHNVYWNL